MPQSVTEYIESKRDFKAKRMILALYRDDIKKAARKYRKRVPAVFEHIPVVLSSHEKKLVKSQIEKASHFLFMMITSSGLEMPHAVIYNTNVMIPPSALRSLSTRVP